MYSFTLGKRGLCEVIHSALPVLTVLSLGPMGQARGLRGSLLGPRSGWANASLIYTPLPSKKLFPNSLYGEILDSMEANMSKPIWHVGRCNTEGLAT